MISQAKQKELQQVMDRAYADYSKKLVAYASFKVSNKSVGEDLVQDTFLKTWGYLLQRGNIDTMKSFLFRVLNNLIVDHYRKQKTFSLDALIEKGYEPRVEESVVSMDSMDGKGALSLVDRLPEAYKKIIQMRYQQDLSLEETAKVTHYSKNCIAVRTYRGLEKLRLLYGPLTY